MEVAPRRLIVGISGASGTIYGLRVLQLLGGSDIETHLVVSRAGDLTRAHELAESAQELRALATVHYPIADIGAAIASGSFRTMGMLVAPCSVSTLAEVATGVTGNLLSRAADVTLASDIEDIDTVREHFRLQSPTLLGHSWGTVLALEYALRYPDRVARLILMNPAPASAGDAALLRTFYLAKLGAETDRQRTIQGSAASDFPAR